MNQFKILIARSNNDLEQAYRLQHKIFVGDQKYISTEEEDFLTDEWDNHSIHVVCNIDDEIVGDGRLIFYSEIAFRVSSSVDLSVFFDDQKAICQISALAVSHKYRSQSIGNAIHYFRILLAKKLNYKYIIASCFQEISLFLINMGFEVLLEKFFYKHYASSEYSVLLAFNLQSERTFFKMNNYFKDKLSLDTMRQIENEIDKYYGEIVKFRCCL